MRPFARNPKDEGLDDGRTTGGGLNDGTVCMDATQVQAKGLNLGVGMWDGPHWVLEFGYNGVFAE